MSLVPEFGPVIEKQPDWTNFFTIWGDGKIDVNLADADTIELITGVVAGDRRSIGKIPMGSRRQAFYSDDRVYNSHG